MSGKAAGRRVCGLCIVGLLVSLTGGCGSAAPVEQIPAPSIPASRQVTSISTPEPSATVPRSPTMRLETVSPTSTSTPQPTSEPTPTEGAKTVTFTIVCDNNPYAPAGPKTLRTSWGFACWVETQEMTVLFDTGGDGATLMHNMSELGLDPLTIDAVVLSHAHGDHTGGLGALLGTGVKPTVYAPASFPGSYIRDVRARTELVEVTDPMVVGPGMYTTGEVGAGIIEQALAVQTRDGLVVVTGCAHPGVDQMVRRASEYLDGEIALVVGGFHLGGASYGRIQGIIADFRELGVEKVGPCHCTGDVARRLFKEEFGDDCILAGVGWSAQYGLRTSE